MHGKDFILIGIFQFLFFIIEVVFLFMGTTEIVKKIDAVRFHNFLRKFSDNICFSSHVLDHLLLFQRDLNSIDKVMAMILREIPRGVGLQQNKRIALFFRRKEGFIRVIIFVHGQSIRIETFYWSASMPNLLRL